MGSHAGKSAIANRHRDRSEPFAARQLHRRGNRVLRRHRGASTTIRVCHRGYPASAPLRQRRGVPTKPAVEQVETRESPTGFAVLAALGLGLGLPPLFIGGG